MKDVVPVVAKHINASSLTVREAAAKTLQLQLLEADCINRQTMCQGEVEALGTAWERMVECDTLARVVAIDALAAGETATTEQRRARNLLQITRSSNTFAEWSSQVRGVGRAKDEVSAGRRRGLARPMRWTWRRKFNRRSK